MPAERRRGRLVSAVSAIVRCLNYVGNDQAAPTHAFPPLLSCIARYQTDIRAFTSQIISVLLSYMQSAAFSFYPIPPLRSYRTVHNTSTPRIWDGVRPINPDKGQVKCTRNNVGV